MSQRETIEEEAKRLSMALCSHVCHTRGLNPWVEECPICGCPNPKYDPDAVSDIVYPPSYQW